MKRLNIDLSNVKKPDNLVDESELTFECNICKDRHWVEFKNPKEATEGNGDIIYSSSVKRVDGKLVEVVKYKQRCECYLKKVSEDRFKSKIKDSGLETMLEKKTFKNFKVTDEWQKELLNMCTNFVKNPKGMLALLGYTGSGKSHLGTATCGNLAYYGYNVTYVEWRTEMDIAQSNYYQVEESKLDNWKNVDVLYIDDLFKTLGYDKMKIPEREFRYAWSVINHRLERNKITIISSELTMKDFYKLDISFAGRLHEYAGDNIFVIPEDESRNYRMKGLL